MSPGPPPTPLEVKRMRGTLRADRANGRPPSQMGSVAPAVPGDAERPPAAVLDAVFDAASLWLATTDGLATSMLRETLEERAVLRELVVNQGGVMYRKDLRDLDAQVMKMLANLGLDPAARARLGLAEVKAADRIDRILDRRHQREPM